MPTKNIFPIKIYTEQIDGYKKINKGLISDINVLRKKDLEGIAWSKQHYRGGYTSYNSITDLHERFPDFITLKQAIDIHAKKYAGALKWDLMGRKLHMTLSWVSIMPEHTYHTMHAHPLSVISGTYYIDVPKGSSSIKLEDPKLLYLMNSPPRKSTARAEEQNYLNIAAQNGQLILFESWLRHEVPPQPIDKERISFSFNYEWY